MTDILVKPTGRRGFLGGAMAGGGLLLLPACSTIPGFGMVDAVQRILFLSSERAFARMLEGGGFWDEQVAQVGFGELLGARGDVVSRILTSALFKSRLENAFGDIAYEGAQRAAPLVTDAVRTIGIQNAIDLVRGGPTAATSFLRDSMGRSLVEAMVPELGEAMRVAQDPLIGQLVSAAVGVDIGAAANRVALSVNDTIWTEIGREEAAIRADPQSTSDPVLIGALGVGSRL